MVENAFWEAEFDAVGGMAADLDESYRVGLSSHLEHAIGVADLFLVVRVGNRYVHQVRRRVQN
jgi:hypothetical protein